MKSHVCGVQGECNDYCGGGQMNNLRAQVAAQAQEIKDLRGMVEFQTGKALEGVAFGKGMMKDRGELMDALAAKDSLLAEQEAVIEKFKGGVHELRKLICRVCSVMHSSNPIPWDDARRLWWNIEIGKAIYDSEEEYLAADTAKPSPDKEK